MLGTVYEFERDGLSPTRLLFIESFGTAKFESDESIIVTVAGGRVALAEGGRVIGSGTTGSLFICFACSGGEAILVDGLEPLIGSEATEDSAASVCASAGGSVWVCGGISSFVSLLSCGRLLGVKMLR